VGYDVFAGVRLEIDIALRSGKKFPRFDQNGTYERDRSLRG
jgi:hypothetical protein